MYEQMTFADILSVTFLPESAGGVSLCSSQGGRKIVRSGLEAAHASPTAQRENSEEMQTSATSGRRSSVSSRSVALNSCLGNRLKTRFAMGGSIEYTQTWKEKSTPSGRPYLAHTASERHTAGTGSTGGVSAWTKTPMAGDAEGGQKEIRLGTNGKYKLRDWATVSAWPTTRANDSKKRGSISVDPRSGLPSDVNLSAWPTPTSRDHKDGNPSNVPVNCLLGRAVWQVFLHGETVSSSSAGMGKLVGYRLNPYFSAWLMGFPKAWTEAGLRAFRKLKASRSRRRKRGERCF